MSSLKTTVSVTIIALLFLPAIAFAQDLELPCRFHGRV